MLFDTYPVKFKIYGVEKLYFWTSKERYLNKYLFWEDVQNKYIFVDLWMRT